MSYHDELNRNKVGAIIFLDNYRSNHRMATLNQAIEWTRRALQLYLRERAK